MKTKTKLQDIEEVKRAIDPADQRAINAIKRVYENTKDADGELHNRIHKMMPYFFPDVLDGEEPPVGLYEGGQMWIANELGCKQYDLSRAKHQMMVLIRQAYSEEIPYQDEDELEDVIQSYYDDKKNKGDSEFVEILEYMFPYVVDGKRPPKDFASGGWGWVADQMGKEQVEISRMKETVESEIKERL